MPPIENLCLAGVVPVLPSLAEDEHEEGRLLNVNADTAAAAVAQAIQAEKLVFLTDTAGILLDKNEPASLIRGLTPDGCRDLIAQGVIDRGMIPKVEACLTSLEAGVLKTHIIDGRLPHALLLEIFTKSGIGTEIVRDERAHAPRAGGRYWSGLEPAIPDSIQIPDSDPTMFGCIGSTRNLQGDYSLVDDATRQSKFAGDNRAVRAICDSQLSALPCQPGQGRGVMDLGRRGQPVSGLLSGVGL